MYERSPTLSGKIIVSCQGKDFFISLFTESLYVIFSGLFDPIGQTIASRVRVELRHAAIETGWNRGSEPAPLVREPTYRYLGG